MAEDTTGEAYLLFDVGHVLAHAAYIARVEGAARLVALADMGTTSIADMGLLEGVRRVTGNLEMLAGRQLLAAAGELRQPCDANGHGVDGVAVTTSVAPSLRVVLIGLTEDISLASAIRAVALPYVNLVRTISLQRFARRWDIHDLEGLIADPPDVIVLVGGTNGGPVAPIRQMGETLSIACSVLPVPRRPVVLFAGNVRAHRFLSSSFSHIAELRLVENIRPSIQEENLDGLRNELIHLLYERELARPGELRQLGQWARNSVVYDLEALAHTLRFIARRYGLKKGVLGVDIGGSGSRLLLVRPAGAALSWASPYGTGAGLAALRNVRNPLAVGRWMHHRLSWSEIRDRLGSMEARPSGVPQADEDWDLQQAAVREALCSTWAEALVAWGAFSADGQATADYELVVARGTALNRARTPGEAALMLIDGLQPVGLRRLALDWANLLPGLAGLARMDPEAAVQVFDHDGLLELGTLLGLRGPLRPGAEALKVRLKVQGQTRVTLSVRAGKLYHLPLSASEQARLEIHPARDVDAGLGWPGRGGTVDVRGGALGVIIDARGRPLAVPEDEEKRRAMLEGWRLEIEGI